MGGKTEMIKFAIKTSEENKRETDRGEESCIRNKEYYKSIIHNKTKLGKRIEILNSEKDTRNCTQDEKQNRNITE